MQKGTRAKRWEGARARGNRCGKVKGRMAQGCRGMKVQCYEGKRAGWRIQGLEGYG